MGKLSRYGAIDRWNPEASARCDRGGEIRKRSDLHPEMMWVGDRLAPNGFLVCDHHRDIPNPQNRLYVLKPDPVPVKNPRPDRAMTPLPIVMDDGTPTPGVTQTASVITVDQWGRPLLVIPSHRFSDAYNYPPPAAGVAPLDVFVLDVNVLSSDPYIDPSTVVVPPLDTFVLDGNVLQ